MLKDGMSYYWKDAEEAVQEIFRVCEKFKSIKKLGYTPLLRDHVLEACRPNRLQIWGTVNKDNANSYARASPELIFLVLDVVCKWKKEVNQYLNERFGVPHVVTFEVGNMVRDTDVNNSYGRFIEPERIISVEKVDMTQPDPHFAKFRNENVKTKYEMVACRT